MGGGRKVHVNMISQRVKREKAKAIEIYVEENADKEDGPNSLEFMKEKEITNLLLEIWERQGVKKRRTRVPDSKVDVVEDDMGEIAKRKRF